jgi:hypothetical protein
MCGERDNSSTRSRLPSLLLFIPYLLSFPFSCSQQRRRMHAEEQQKAELRFMVMSLLYISSLPPVLFKLQFQALFISISAY